MLITTAAGDIFIFILLKRNVIKSNHTSTEQNAPIFFVCLVHILDKNKASHFMWIVCLADDSHEMPSLIFSKKYFLKKYM